MTVDSTATNKGELEPRLDTNLSDAETYFIGEIVAQWSFLENEIFESVVSALPEDDVKNPPKAIKSAMSNAQFSEVLEVWHDRVVAVEPPERQAVLQRQYDRIKALSPFRHAVVHSMWEWTPANPRNITATRVIKKSIKRVIFQPGDFEKLAGQIADIRFKVHYPGGIEDRFAELGETGSYVSREFAIAVTCPVPRDAV